MILKSKVLGGVFLILSLSVGAGMLALPMVIAGVGYYHSILLFLFIWLISTLSAFYVLEASLWFPSRSNFISMVGSTLGKPAQLAVWVSYLFLLYSLLSAYASGGANVLHDFLSHLYLNFSGKINVFLFTLIFGSALFWGVRFIDWTNRGLMMLKILAYFLLVIFIFPQVNIDRLSGGNIALMSGATMVVICAFCYAAIIPTLRDYFEDHLPSLRLTIFLGSLLPLVFYLLWNFVVQGSLSAGQDHLFEKLKGQDDGLIHFIETISQQGSNSFVYVAVYCFTSICLVAAFLSASLALFDFIKDGLSTKLVKLNNKMALVLMTLLPPMIIVMLSSNIFLKFLNYAGIICVFLFILIPALMVWQGRYKKNMACHYQVMGGKQMLIANILVGCALFLFCLYQLI